MKKSLFIIFLFIFLFTLSSCDNGMSKSSKVYIVGLGLNYKDSNYLSGTCMDVEEILMYYKYILDKKNIDNKLFLMLDKREKIDNTGNYIEYTDTNSRYAPTVENLNNLLDDFSNGCEEFDKLDSDDLLVIYYSGHGNTPDEKKITTSDGIVTVYDGSSVGAGAFILPDYARNNYSYILHNDLVEILVNLQCQIAFICDSCHSGHLAGQIAEVGERIKDSESFIGANSEYGGFDFSKLYKSSNISGVFAAIASEVSYADESSTIKAFANEKHSIFTGYVMLNCLKWKHSSETFDVILAGVDKDRGIYTPLLNDVVVKGEAASDSVVKSLKLSTSDIMKAFPKWGVAVSNGRGGTNWISQHTSMSTGINSKVILW